MSPLTQALFEVVRELFPAAFLHDSAEFRPLFDLEKGDVSSSIAIHLARQTRGNADQIGRSIIAHLPFIPGAEWRCERGYVILAGSPPARLLGEEAAAMRCGADGSVPRIGLLLPDVTIPLYARLRLIACVGFQALCAVAVNSPCDVVAVGGSVERVASPADVSHLIEQIVGVALKRCDTAFLADEASIRVLGGCGSVWTAHHYYDRLSPTTRAGLARLADAALQERKEGVLRMPPDGWLLARDRALSELLSVESLKATLAQVSSPELWLRWILHMVSSIPSGDLDPAVSLYNELASPRWGLQVLQGRLQQVVGAVGIPSLRPLDLDHETMQKHRVLVLRTLFLPAWVKIAAFEGSGLEAITALEEFVREAHAFLNSPSVRGELLKAPAADDEIMQIVAGLSFALSSIIPLERSLDE